MASHCVIDQNNVPINLRDIMERATRVRLLMLALKKQLLVLLPHFLYFFIYIFYFSSFLKFKYIFFKLKSFHISDIRLISQLLC